MVANLMTNTPARDPFNNGVVAIVGRHTLTAADTPAATKIGTIPAGAMILSIASRVVTAVAGGTPVLGVSYVATGGAVPAVGTSGNLQNVLAEAAGRKILVLGDMGELGAAARGFHERIGAEARAAGVDTLLAMGEWSAYSVTEFGVGARHFKKIEELIAEVQGLLATGDTILIKGSRFMQMERVVKRVESQPAKR